MAEARLLERTGRFQGRLNRLQLRLVAYLAGADAELSGRGRVDAFKDQLLIHQPEVYAKMYDDEGDPVIEDISDEEVIEDIPQNEGEARRMLAELRAFGVGG
jgi:hypothetical protein